MTKLKFSTVDVFTSTRFGGNPLAVVHGGEELSSETMQAIAAEFNLSETVFVLPRGDERVDSRLRIFNRTEEMAFAGHPLVGTAFVLARSDPHLVAAAFAIPAGRAEVAIDRLADGTPVGAAVDAPQPLSLGEEFCAEPIARLVGLAAEDIILASHPPILASVGNPYVIAEVDAAALARCVPDLAAFRALRLAHPQLGTRLSLHLYARAGNRLRARMFAPLAGTWEDPATGSANAPLAGLLLSLDPGAQQARFEIHQGIEMGRPSLLDVTARRTPEGILTRVRGTCVPVMNGELCC